MTVKIDLQVALGNEDEYEYDAGLLNIPDEAELTRIADAATEDFVEKGEITIRIVG